MKTYNGWSNYPTWLVAYWFDQRRVRYWHALVKEQRKVALHAAVKASLKQRPNDGNLSEGEYVQYIRQALQKHFEQHAPDLPYGDHKVVASLALFRSGNGTEEQLADHLKTYFEHHGPEVPVMKMLASVQWLEIAKHLISAIYEVDWDSQFESLLSEAEQPYERDPRGERVAGLPRGNGPSGQLWYSQMPPTTTAQRIPKFSLIGDPGALITRLIWFVFINLVIYVNH
ncbi:MAG: hypothetical protein JSV66_01245 [Trueperaceae bacterium]|nr:MAG: hypothetical protein JSV66_01245 [Trueperaceae bacterium]